MSKNKHRNRNYNGQKRTTGKDLQIQTTTIELKGRKYEMNFDLNALRHSDLIVVNFNDPSSLGTCAELAIGHELKIPIIGINRDGTDLHPWLCCFCDRMCNDIREAVSHVVDFYLN